MLITRVLKWEKQSDVIARFEDERGPRAKKCRQSLEERKGREWILLLNTQREHSMQTTLILVQ